MPHSGCKTPHCCLIWLCCFAFWSLAELFQCAGAGSAKLALSATDLLAALRDPIVTQIEIGEGIIAFDSLVAASSALVIGPNRHVKIVGNSTAIQAFHSSSNSQALEYASGIDFGTASGFLRLADNTTIGFRDLVIWHGLSQLGYDVQPITLQQPSARASLTFTRTIKVRDGCLPLQIFVQHVTSYIRLADRPGQQVASLQPLCYVLPRGSPAPPANTTTTADNVTCFSEVLAIGDLATTITRSNNLSYSLYEQNSTYWCRAYASMSCLSASGPEQCVRDLLSSLFSNGTNSSSTAATPSSTSSSSSDGNRYTNILLPAVLTGVMTLCFVSATVWCIHRRGRTRRGSSLGFDLGDVEGHTAAGAAAAGGRGDHHHNTRRVGSRVGNALAWLLPRSAAREVQKDKPNVPGYVPVVSKEALDRIAKVRAELSSKMVGASGAEDLSDVLGLQLVGRGTFGRVYKGEWKGVTVALKVISVPVSQYGQAQWQHVLGEAAISTLLNHPCVLQTYSVALLEYSPTHKQSNTGAQGEGSDNALLTVGNNPANNGGGGPEPGQVGAGAPAAGPEDMAPFYQLKMVSEFCEGGSVVVALRRMQFYDSVGGGMARLQAVSDIATQVASGMAYLHSANIIHADLKAANVLLKRQPGSGRLQAKVADFGLSFRLEEPEATHATKGQLGSLTHMAPEVLLHVRVSKASDVYSFGIFLYELYTGQQAYWDVPQPMLAYHVASAGGRPLLPPICPPAYRSLAKACWSQDTAARPTFEQILEALQSLAADVQNTFTTPPESPSSEQQGTAFTTTPPNTAAGASAAAVGETVGSMAGGDVGHRAV